MSEEQERGSSASSKNKDAFVTRKKKLIGDIVAINKELESEKSLSAKKQIGNSRHIKLGDNLQSDIVDNEKSKSKINFLVSMIKKKSIVLFSQDNSLAKKEKTRKKNELVSVPSAVGSKTTVYQNNFVVNNIESKQTENIKYYGRFGVFAVLGLFVVICIWGFLSPFASAVVAVGKIVIDGSDKIIQSPDGGIIESVAVKEGDNVQEGQILVTIDSTRVKSRIGVLKEGLVSLLSKEARLLAERDNKDIVKFPFTRLNKLSNYGAKEAISVQRRLFKDRKSRLEKQVSQLKKRIEQLNRLVDSFKNQILLNKKIEKINKDDLNTVRSLVKNGLASKQRQNQSELRLIQIHKNTEEIRGNIAQKFQQIAEIKLNISQLYSNMSFEVTTELAGVQTSMGKLLQELNGLEDELKHTKIRSPVTGKVLDLKVHTLGGFISPGDKIMRIIPKEDALILEAHVSPKDIDNIKLNQFSWVTITAFDHRSHLDLDAKVIVVPTDTTVQKMTGTEYYKVLLKIDKPELKKLKGKNLVPGMNAQVFIKTGERSVISYLMKPLLSVLNRTWRET